MSEKRIIVRKEQRGMRLSGHLTIQATRAVEKIQEIYGTRTYEILSTAVINYVRAMEGQPSQVLHPLYTSTPTNKAGLPRQRAESQSPQALSVAKAIWCEEYGGTVMGNVCHYDKFEVTMAGTTESSKRSVELSSMPDDKIDFKNMVLGSYANISEARKAADRYKNEDKTK